MYDSLTFCLDKLIILLLIIKIEFSKIETLRKRGRPPRRWLGNVKKKKLKLLRFNHWKAIEPDQV